MYNFKKIVLGVAPTRRDTFPAPKKAEEHKSEVMARIYEICNKIHDLEVVDLDEIIEGGLLYDVNDSAKVAEYFQSKGVDALFVPHCNFGQEEAVAKLAKILGKPVLVWGPRDGYPDKTDTESFRCYDTQCGMFATTRALLRYGVTYTYVENCWIDSPIIEKAINDFVRVASVVKAFKGMRVLQISNRPRQFLSVKINEGELLEKFGIEVTSVETNEMYRTIDNLLENRIDEVNALVDEWNSKVVFKVNPHFEDFARPVEPDNKFSEQQKLAAVDLAMQELCEKYECCTIATECWTMYHSKYDISTCFAHGDLSERGITVACECDINGAITGAICQAVTRGETPPFFADITVRHPQNDNAELMWHCGPYPASLARDAKPEILSCQGSFELKPGAITMTRFDGSRGIYNLLAEEGKGVDGPKSTGTYVWWETKDWAKVERKLMTGPYIHHSVGIYGNYQDVLREACRYINVEFDSVD